jgi:transcription-repair coupling factor (superfamily II helicase)
LPWREEVEVRIDLPLQAFIPKGYVSDENLRLEAYRKVASARSSDELTEVRAELEDRYGAPVPGPVEALFEVAELRRLMTGAGISEAATVAGNLRIRPLELEDSRQVRLQRLLPDATWRPDTRTLLVPERVVPTAGVVGWVTKILEQLTS